MKPLYTPQDWQREAPSDSSEPWRSDVSRDYARVIHTPAFRRLQGKTQLYPGHESDFFRNRLTHSLEVSQIAESIAARINAEHEYFQQNPINPRLCALASLMHDLGHPPFGHNGEEALDTKMRHFGGFEGNAQTLRLVSRLEKKTLREATYPGQDLRLGLNLAYRTLASIIKYDRVIPPMRTEGDALAKGYYGDEAGLVDRIKKAVAPEWPHYKLFKTIECSIMDVADDIAYSTYDLEDSLKAGFQTPALMMAADEKLLERVAQKVARNTGLAYVATKEIRAIIAEIFAGLTEDGPMDADALQRAFLKSRQLAENGYERTMLSTRLIREFVKGVSVHVNEDCPPMSEVRLEPLVHKKVETLKNYNFEATIFSTRLKILEYRGGEVVDGIFEALASAKGHLLMPDDVRALWVQFEMNASARMRVISDFIASMTERYALEFYGRLHSDSPQSIFKPT